MTNNQGLVSVIIPTHQGVNSIVETIFSVILQTYRDLEIIIVDDNGKDTLEQIATARKIREHFGKFDNVFYYTHDVSRGGAAARNTGLLHARGEFIAFLDDDDVFKSENIQKHVECLMNHDMEYGFSYCDFEVIRDGYKKEIVTSDFKGDFLYDFLMGHVRVGSSLLCFRRNVINELHGFDESFKRHQDWELIVRALYKWKGTNTRYVGVEKYILSRNTPKNPKISEDYRLYYLEKMNPIINSLGRAKKEKVLGSNYYEIAKDYFKAKRIVEGVYWLLKTKSPILYSAKAVKSIYIQRKKRNAIR